MRYWKNLFRIPPERSLVEVRVDGCRSAFAAHRGLDASIWQAFNVSNADVLRAPVGVVNQAAASFGLRW